MRDVDPAIRAELEELDAALAGNRHDPEIALIAAQVRSDAPRMTPAFEARLEQAVGGGFPRAEPSGGGGWWRRPWFVPAVSGLAAAAVAIAVVLPGDATQDAGVVPGPATAQEESDGGGRVQAAKAPPDPYAAGGSVAADTALPTVAVPEGELRELLPVKPRQRRTQQAAQLTITTPTADFQDTSDAVGATVDRLRGFVQRSDVTAGDDGGQATFDLRIPAARLEEAIAALAQLGHVRSRSQQSDDITARFESARTYLRDARAEREGLLRALAAADSAQEIESLRARLRVVNGQIGIARAQLLRARRAANLARVSVVLVATDEAGEGSGSGPWTPGRAFDDAVDLLQVIAGGLIVGLAAGIPAAVLALLLWLAWRARRRREREAALEPRPSTM